MYPYYYHNAADGEQDIFQDEALNNAHTAISNAENNQEVASISNNLFNSAPDDASTTTSFGVNKDGNSGYWANNNQYGSIIGGMQEIIVQRTFVSIGNSDNSSISSGGSSINGTGGENSTIENLGTAIHLGADSYGIVTSSAKVLVEGVSKGLTRSGTVVGAIVGGVPASINIYNSIASGQAPNVDDIAAVVLATGGVAVEFFGIGEVWDTVGLGIAIGSTSLDIYEAASKH